MKIEKITEIQHFVVADLHPEGIGKVVNKINELIDVVNDISLTVGHHVAGRSLNKSAIEDAADDLKRIANNLEFLNED